jgi:hypothetical protein
MCADFDGKDTTMAAQMWISGKAKIAAMVQMV